MNYHAAQIRKQIVPLPSSGFSDGFSLVEVTVAIGIFAFVAVGILGLLPAALKQRADSSRETRAVLVAEELFSSVQAAQSISNVVLRRGTKRDDVINLDLSKSRIAIGYSVQSSVPFFAWWPGSDKGQYKNPDKIWQDGKLDDSALGNDIDLLALLHATNTATPGLFRLTVEVRSPANSPLTNTVPVVFTTMFYRP
jgi:type II secretory pathway pseudopilin PulG